jgi:MipA family protein
MQPAATISPITSGSVAVITLAAALLCLLLPQSALAQDGGPMGDGPITGSSEALLGLGVANGAAYLGSDERKTRALPVIAARWRNGWFAGAGGVGYRFGGDSALSWGPRLTADFGRDEDDADALRGMGDIEARPELGAFVSYALLPGLRFGSSFRYGSGNDRDGLLGDVSLRGMVPLSAGLRLNAGLVATVANTKAMQSQFGVDAGQSLRTSYAIYTPDSGLRDIQLQIGGIVNLGSNAMLMLGVNTRSLMGDAVDSPLTRKRTSVGALATLSFKL